MKNVKAGVESLLGIVVVLGGPASIFMEKAISTGSISAFGMSLVLYAGMAACIVLRGKMKFQE